MHFVKSSKFDLLFLKKSFTVCPLSNCVCVCVCVYVTLCYQQTCGEQLVLKCLTQGTLCSYNPRKGDRTSDPFV